MMALRPGDNFFIKPISDLSDDEARHWDTLLATGEPQRRSFMSREYAAAVRDVGGDVLVAIICSSKVPVFFLPLQRATGVLGMLRVYEPVGGVMTDYFGAVAADGVQVDPIDILDAAGGTVNAIYFTHLDESQQRLGLVGSEHRIGLRTRLGAPAASYWSNLRKADKKLVYDTERREKKLIKEFGPLTFAWRSEASDADIEWLIDSKKGQYARTGRRDAPLFTEANAALLRRLLKSDDKHCQGVLSVLRCGEDIVAAHFGLRCHEMLHVWFPVYNPKFSNYSPGRILFKHMFDAAAEQGVQVLDRGEGDTQAKRDFANEEHLFARGVWMARGLRGLAARMALSVSWRWNSWTQ